MTKPALSRYKVVELIEEERKRQDQKYGSLEERHLSVGEWLLVLRGELDEAMAGWYKGSEPPHHPLNEVLQIAAVAVACLEQHGLPSLKVETPPEYEEIPYEEEEMTKVEKGSPLPTSTDDEDDPEFEAGEDAEAEAASSVGYYDHLRTLQENLRGKGVTLMQWSKKQNSESSQPSSLVEYRILAGEVDKIIGKGNHNLLLGVLLGFPIHSQSRPGDKFVRFLLHFIRPLIDKVDDQGQVVWEMKGNRRIKGKVANPKFREEFKEAIVTTWSQITMEE